MFIKPDYNLKSIYDIDLDELRKQGVKAMLFDLDSTLMASKSGIYSDEVYSFIRSVEEKFFIAVVSNNKNPQYIEKVKAITPAETETTSDTSKNTDISQDEATEEES